jgi:hypothetical protein
MLGIPSEENNFFKKSKKRKKGVDKSKKVSYLCAHKTKILQVKTIIEIFFEKN